MAVLPDYVSGTITVTQGDVNFTGTNTLWRTMGFREGDTVQLQGFTAIIKGTSEFGNPIESNVAGQFVEPWPGQSGTFAYRMRFLPDGARFAGKSTNLIELLGNGVLANLAELGVEDGKTPVGNAAGQYELKPTSGFGIQDPNGSLGKLAALTLEENKVVTTDGSGNVQQIDLGTLGRALLALANGASAQYVRGDGTLQTLNSAAVGLGNVNNTSDANKPISTATQTALNAKANLSGATITGTYAFQVPFSVQTNNLAAATLIGFRDANSTNRWSAVLGAQNNTAPLIFVSFDFNGNYVRDALTIAQNGNVSIPGALTAGSKSFEIDHPLDPFNKDLIFMSTEAPKAGVEFWGTVRLVNGQAEVDIDASSNLSPGTFVALTQKAIALKPNNLDSGVDVRATRIDDGKFTVIANDASCQDEVSWHVKAERADPYIKSNAFCDPVTGILFPEREKDEL